MKTFLAWTTPEYEHRERSNDWYWSVGIVAVGGAVLAILFNDLLFAVVIVVAAVAIVLHALRHPGELTCEIQDRGVLMNTTLYPYRTLESFALHEHEHPNMLILTSQKLFMPHITIPLASDIHADEVRDILLDYLPEHEVLPSISEKIMDRLGF
ncbi:MAG: hypothetical protein AAB458_02740 [Patescibacteria group bacterium]